MYSYDHRTATAKLDVHDKWRDIVDKHKSAMDRDFLGLIQDMVKYLKSAGLDLDTKRSFLGTTDGGSDGTRRTGTLFVSERRENNLQADGNMIRRWVEEATGLYGFVRKIGEGPEKRQVDDQPIGHWAVDVDES